MLGKATRATVGNGVIFSTASNLEQVGELTCLQMDECEDKGNGQTAKQQEN